MICFDAYVFPAFLAFLAPVCSFDFISSPDTPSIKAGYSEYQGKILVFDTFVKIPIMPSLVQEMQEMQDFSQLQKVKMKLLENVA